MTVAIPGYFECDDCGFFHPANFAGSCDDADTRFSADQLDKQHGDGRWYEIALEEEMPAPKPKRNLERILRITPDTDLNGNRLEIGCRVRAFHCYQYVAENDSCPGADTLGDGQGYWEGELLAIGVKSPDPRTTDPCYQIRADTDVCRATSRHLTNRQVRLTNLSEIVHIPVNGIPIVDRGVDLGWRTFGVFRITADE